MRISEGGTGTCVHQTVSCQCVMCISVQEIYSLEGVMDACVKLLGICVEEMYISEQEMYICEEEMDTCEEVTDIYFYSYMMRKVLTFTKKEMR